MNKRTYNLIYACCWLLFGPDEEYENADKKEYEKYAIEMLQSIQEELGKQKQESMD